MKSKRIKTHAITEVFLRTAKERILLLPFGSSEEAKTKATEFALLINANNDYPIEVWVGDNLHKRFRLGRPMSNDELIKWSKEQDGKN